MIKKNSCILFFLYIQSIFSAQTWHTLTFFFRPIYYYDAKINEQKFWNQFKTPGKVTIKMLNNQIFPKFISGIYVTYLGNITFSDLHGQVSFSNKLHNEKLYLVVTKNIAPVFMQGKTIHHFQAPEKYALKTYEYMSIKDEKQNKYWHVAQIEPTHKLPLESIVIFSEPKYVVIPDGTYPTNPDKNIVLPDIYIKPSIPISLNALQFLKIKKYFSTTKKFYQYGDQSNELIVD